MRWKGSPLLQSHKVIRSGPSLTRVLPARSVVEPSANSRSVSSSALSMKVKTLPESRRVRSTADFFFCMAVLSIRNISIGSTHRMADYPRVAGASVAFLLDSEKILFSFRTFAKEEKSRATEKDALLQFRRSVYTNMQHRGPLTHPMRYKRRPEIRSCS